MAMTEDDRLALRNALTDTIGERETRVLMEAVPPVDYDQLATKTDLGLLRRDLDAQFVQVEAQFVQVDSRFAQVNAQFAQVDAEIKTLRADLTTEMRTGFADVRTEMASQLRVTVLTHVGSMIGLTALIAGLT
jgi:hypothetical protein